MTDRDTLRQYIAGRWTINDVENRWRRGIISEAVFMRFERLWAWSTATEHPLTRGVPLDRWRARRERIRRAIAQL